MKRFGMENRMNFHVMTLFPEMITQAMEVSITGRAIRAGLIHVDAVDIREIGRASCRERV